MKRLDDYLRDVPNELEAPAGSLTEQALWYQQKLEKLAPEIEELEPILEPKEQKKRGSKKGKALDASLKSKLKGLDIPEEDKVKLARTLGIEI